MRRNRHRDNSARFRVSGLRKQILLRRILGACPQLSLSVPEREIVTALMAQLDRSISAHERFIGFEVAE